MAARHHLRPLLVFSFVGVLNTIVYYLVYLALLPFLPYLVAHLAGWFVSMSFSFVMNCRLTYRVPVTWWRYALYPLTALPNLVFTTVGVVAFIELLNVSERLAPFIAGVLAIPFTYTLGRYLMVGRDAFADVRAEAESLDGEVP